MFWCETRPQWSEEASRGWQRERALLTEGRTSRERVMRQGHGWQSRTAKLDRRDWHGGKWQVTCAEGWGKSEEQAAGTSEATLSTRLLLWIRLRSYQRFKQRTRSDKRTEEPLGVENDCKRAKEGRESGKNCCRIHRPGAVVEVTGSMADSAARLSPEGLWPWVAVFIIRNFSPLSNWSITSGVKGWRPVKRQG